ncbi:MAG: pilus assembly protein N-terminal domain-containing protein [Beijerinckiaceae bacterium]
MARRFIPALSAAAGLAFAVLTGMATGASASETITLMLDRATVIRAPEKTSMVVIGNPAIADVAVQKNGVMVLTGKSYGETNLLALDDQGKLVSESWLRVQALNRNSVVVYRAGEAETYSCTPQCQPTVALGDSDKHFGKAGAQLGSRNGLAAGNQPNAGR